MAFRRDSATVFVYGDNLDDALRRLRNQLSTAKVFKELRLRKQFPVRSRRRRHIKLRRLNQAQKKKK